MNRKGFSLMEIIVVIIVIGMLLLFVLPNLTGIFSNSIKSTMEIQENELKEAGSLYLEDYCKNRIGNNMCPGTIKRNSNYTYSGYVSLSTLESLEYIEEITLEGSDCNGCVIYTENKAEAYLICSNYETETDVNFKSICNIN